MFLHVLADTLGSIVIVISSLARHYYGWTVVDPLASLVVAGVVITLSVPLLRATTLVLLQRQPTDLDASIQSVLSRVRRLGGVIACREKHFWCVTSRHVVEGSLRLVVTQTLSEARCDA